MSFFHDHQLYLDFAKNGKKIEKHLVLSTWTLYSRCHGDEQHVSGSEDDVGAIAHPDVVRRVHDEEAGGHQHGVEAQGQLAPQRPGDGQVSHQQRRQRSWGPAGHNNVNSLLHHLRDVSVETV